MPKKKMTKEEIKVEIERQVREKQKVWLKEESLKAETHFVEETLRLLVYKFKFENLSLSRTFQFAKALIDSMESDDAKADMRHIFAEYMVYIGANRDAIKDREAVEKSIDAIKKYLQGQT